MSTVLLVTCAMLSKEQGITVVAICLIYDLCVVNKVSAIHPIKSRSCSHLAAGSMAGGRSRNAPNDRMACQQGLLEYPPFSLFYYSQT